MTLGLTQICWLALLCWQTGIGSQEPIAVLKEINKVYAKQKNIYMKVQYRLYPTKKSLAPSETLVMETYRMGNDKFLYKNKAWEYIQNGELVLRIDREAKVLHLIQTKVIDKPAQDPMAAFQQFADRCPHIISLPDEAGAPGLLFECPATGYQEAELRYSKDYHIKGIHLLASPGKALGEGGGYLKLDVLQESPFQDANKFTFGGYLKKTAKGYVPLAAYAQYRFIDQSHLYSK